MLSTGRPAAHGLRQLERARGGGLMVTPLVAGLAGGYRCAGNQWPSTTTGLLELVRRGPGTHIDNGF
jgi:hypothetical protein